MTCKREWWNTFYFWKVYPWKNLVVNNQFQILDTGKYEECKIKKVRHRIRYHRLNKKQLQMIYKIIQFGFDESWFDVNKNDFNIMPNPYSTEGHVINWFILK